MSCFEMITTLQYRLKAALDRIKDFESGDIFLKMKEGQRRLQNYYERRVRCLKREVASLKRQLVANREMWFRTFQDLQEECQKKLEKISQQVEKLQEKLDEEKKKNADLRKKYQEKVREVTDERAKCIDEKEKNRKLVEQVRQNFQNSSTPSSQARFRGKVPNNRPKTDRKEGGQPGHPGYSRKKHAITESLVFIDAPEKIKNDPNYYIATGAHSEIHKQVLSIVMTVKVTDFWSYVYRNRKTGAKYHPPFPDNVNLEVNYDESIRGFIFLLKNHLNVSDDKISEFLKELTDGELNVSHGMINNITKEFSQKTEPERAEIFAKLMTADVMYTDMTATRHNGKLKNVVVCSDKENVFYAFKEHKGDKGMQGTPAELYNGILCHDHDKTMYHYASAHQECNGHHMRYLKGAMETETDFEWHTKMHALLKEMNDVREKSGRTLTEEQIEDFEHRYDEILDLADKEYNDNPPSKYYRKGYNLSRELRDYKESTLLFLHDARVDFTNNESERNARKVKRHMVVCGTFRGKQYESAEAYCNSMSVLQTMRNRKPESVYKEVTEIFSRKKPPRIKNTEGTPAPA